MDVPLFHGRNYIFRESGPGGPIFLEFWSPGPKFSPDQNFRDRTIPSPLGLAEMLLTNFLKLRLIPSGTSHETALGTKYNRSGELVSYIHIYIINSTLHNIQIIYITYILYYLSLVHNVTLGRAFRCIM